MILYPARTKGTHGNRANTFNHVNNKGDFYWDMEESGVEVNEDCKEEERKKWRLELGKDLWNIQEKWNNGQVL